MEGARGGAASLHPPFPARGGPANRHQLPPRVQDNQFVEGRGRSSPPEGDRIPPV